MCADPEAAPVTTGCWRLCQGTVSPQKSWLLLACVDDSIGYVYTGVAMPLNIRNEDVNRLAERLARITRLNKTEAVKLALENELKRSAEVIPLRERLRPLQDRILARAATGIEADKAFYDDLSGDA